MKKVRDNQRQKRDVKSLTKKPKGMSKVLWVEFGKYKSKERFR